MTTEEKLQKVNLMLEEGKFPSFVAVAIQDVISSGAYSDQFVDLLYNNIQKENSLVESYAKDA